jgi:hypothetical protein
VSPARAAVLIGALAVTGCGLLDAPEWVTTRTALPSCGDVTVSGDEAPPATTIDCLMEGLRHRRGAELIVRHRQPAQGLPVDSYQRLLPDGTAELILHLDPNRSGAEGWELHRCQGVQVSHIVDGSLQFNDCEPVPSP